MTLVIDASIVLDLMVSGTSLDELTDMEPIGPPLLWTEVTAILRRSAWRGALTDDQASEALDGFLAGSVTRRSPADLYRESLGLATRLRWARTYDAEYVALARIERCRLLTSDRRLKRGAGHLAEIIGPTEL